MVIGLCKRIDGGFYKSVRSNMGKMEKGGKEWDGLDFVEM